MSKEAVLDAAVEADRGVRKVADALSLATGFGLYIVACDSAAVGEAVVRFLSGLSSQPPWVRIDPHSGGRRFPRFEAEEMAASVLERLDSSPSGDPPGAFVLDATHAQEGDIPAWEFLFIRMNLARNVISARLRAPLLLLITPEMESVFAHAAPDFWSIRSMATRIAVAEGASPAARVKAATTLGSLRGDPSGFLNRTLDGSFFVCPLCLELHKRGTQHCPNTRGAIMLHKAPEPTRPAKPYVPAPEPRPVTGGGAPRPTPSVDLPQPPERVSHVAPAPNLLRDVHAAQGTLTAAELEALFLRLNEGDRLRRAGDVVAARECFLAITVRLRSAYAASQLQADLLHLLATAYNRLGDLRWERDSALDRLHWYQQAYHVRCQQYGANPHDVEVGRAYVRSLERVAGLGGAESSGATLALRQEAVRVSRAVLDATPGDAASMQDLVFSLIALGARGITDNDGELARRALTEALAVAKRLIEVAPYDVKARYTRAAALISNAMLADTSGLSGSQRWMEASRELEALLARDPCNEGWRQAAEVCRNALAVSAARTTPTPDEST